MHRILLMSLMVAFTSCAYRVGTPERRVPGGFREVAVPVFTNETLEPGIEVFFTNSLIREFERSRVARVTDRDAAEAIVVGKIETISLMPGSQKKYDALDNPYQPRDTVLAVDYRVVLVANVQIVNKVSEQVLWNGRFTGERSFNASQVTLPGLNTVNPNYNLSVRNQTIETLAGEMMSEAFDRITENF